VSIDIGCGFNSQIHYPNDADISLDINLHLADEEFLDMIKTPLIASAEDLPFRDGVASKIWWRAVMEHLPRPIKALEDGKRVLRREGEGEVVIPIEVSHQRHYLKILFTQFPFSIPDVVACMRRMSPHLGIRGFPHASDVRPKHIAQIFPQNKVEPVYYRHKWFYGWWGRIIRRLLGGREPVHDSQGYYRVMIWK